MAAEHIGKVSPKTRRLEQFDHQTDSQSTEIIQSNFVSLLEDSQQTQNAVTSNWHDSDGFHENDVMDKPPQPMKGAFFSRPQPEDPLDFQHGFQYSKAPTRQILPTQLGARPKVISRQGGSRNDSVVRTQRQFYDVDSLTADALFQDPRDVRAATTQVIEPLPNTEEKSFDAILTQNAPGSDDTEGRPEKRDLSAARDHPTLRPPFRITSPLNKTPAFFQGPKGNTRSPAAKLGKPKLSKAVADIQRKALIQSTQTQSHLESQTDKVSPSMFNEQELVQHVTGTPEVSAMRIRKHQEPLNSNDTFNRQPVTPKGRILDAAKRPQNKQSSIRAESRASNVSKLRAPLAPGHKRSEMSQSGRILRESHVPLVSRHKLAYSLNEYFDSEDSQKKYWRKKMENMKNELAESDHRVAEYLEKIQRQSQMINNLQTEKEEHDALCQKQASRLADVEKREQGLRDRMKEYRNHLNDSTKEQQNIFKYFQPRYQEMREQLRQAENNHQSSLEQALSTTDKIRDKMRKSVEEVRTLSEQEIQKLHIEIAILQEKLVEREKEVDREKNHINDLRQELKESHDMNKDAVQVLSAQNQELMTKSNEGAIHAQNIENCLNRQGLEIRSLLELLETTRANTVSHSELAQSLKVLQTEVSESVLSEFREYAASDRELSSKATMGLREDISAIHEVCSGLGKQIQDQQNALEWKEKHGKVQMEHQAACWEVNRLEKELLKMKDEARTQFDRHEDLQQELATLRAGMKATGEAEKRIKSLEEAKQKTRESLNEKETHIRGLEEKLRGAEEALNVRNHQLEDQGRRIRDEQAKHELEIAGCHKQQEEAVELARAKESAEARMQHQIVQECLQAAEQNYSQLEQELIQVKHEAENALQTKERECALQMKETIEPALGRIDEVLDGLQALEQEKCDLAANLEAWSSDRIELSLLQQVVQKLANDQQTTIGNGRQLWELLDVQKKLEGTWLSHKAEVDAIERATELERSVNADRERENRRRHKGTRPNKTSQVENLRVTIQSPANGVSKDGTVVPMSIEEERVTRRRAASPTGIMKPVPPQAEGRLVTTKEATERPRRQVANRGAAPALASHSAYNRPVLGTEELAGDTIPEDMETVFAETSSILKRKRVESNPDQRNNTEENKQQSNERRPTKISRSMSSYFSDPIPKQSTTKLIQQQAQLGRSRGGPIERRSRSFITYGSKGSSTQ